MNLEAQELVTVAERRVPLIADLIKEDSEGHNKVVLPKSAIKDRIMRALVASCIIDETELSIVVGLENIDKAEEMANGGLKTVVRNHQDYTFIAVYRHILESVGKKQFVDDSTFPTGMDIYEKYFTSLLPAKETAVMVIAPQDRKFIKRGLLGGDLYDELTEPQRGLVVAYDNGCNDLMVISSRVLEAEAKAGKWISLFPEAEPSPNKGMLQRAQGEVSRYFLPRGMTILPIWMDGLYSIFGPDVEDSPDTLPDKVKVRMVIGDPFYTDQVREAYKKVRGGGDVTMADIVMRQVYNLAPNRCDPRYADFYESLPSLAPAA